MPMQRRGRYHASIARSAATRARRAACNSRFCAAAILSRPCLLRVIHVGLMRPTGSWHVRCTSDSSRNCALQRFDEKCHEPTLADLILSHCRHAGGALAKSSYRWRSRSSRIVVCHVGSARLAFRRGNGIEGSLSAVECAAPVPEEFAGAAVQRTGRPILVAFKSGQFAGHRPVDFAVILVETRGIVGHPVENDELGHGYLLLTSLAFS